MKIPKGRMKQHDYSLLVCILAHALDLGPSFTSPQSILILMVISLFVLKCIYNLKKGKT